MTESPSQPRAHATGTGAHAGIEKEQSMLRQKEMIAGHFRQLATAHDDGRKVVFIGDRPNLRQELPMAEVYAVIRADRHDAATFEIVERQVVEVSNHAHGVFVRQRLSLS